MASAIGVDQPLRLHVAGKEDGDCIKYPATSPKDQILVTSECRVGEEDHNDDEDVHGVGMRHAIKEDDDRKCLLKENSVFPTVSCPESPARPFIDRMTFSLKTFLVCSLLAFVSVQATQRSHIRDTAVRQTVSSPVVTVKNGSYKGLYSPEYEQDFFLGMRYAQVT